MSIDRATRRAFIEEFADPHGGVLPSRRVLQDPVSIISAGANLIGGMMSSDAQSDAAGQASAAQLQASQEGIAEQRRQFDQVRQLLQPYVSTGNQSLGAQGDLVGINGDAAQQQAIARLQASPLFQSQLKVGENRLLANASATGGLRGGNVQAALGMFAPQLLAQQINDQYTRLGGLTSIGQNAAVGVGNAGMGVANNVSNLLQQGGAAAAGGALAQGRAQSNMFNSIAGGIGQYVGSGGTFGFGGVPTPDAVNLGTATGADLGLFY